MEENKSTLGEQRNNEGSEKRKKALEITSVEQAVGVFMKDSVGIYVKQKSNEHSELTPATNDEIKKWTKQDLGSLLRGISEKATGDKKEEIQLAMKSMASNLDNYVNELDANLSKNRDAILRGKIIRDAILKGKIILNPRELAKDEALIKAATKNIYAKAGEALSSGSLDIDSPKKNITLNRLKAKVLKVISGAFKLCGCKDKSEKYAKYAQDAKNKARLDSVDSMIKMFKAEQEKVPQIGSNTTAGIKKQKQGQVR